MLKRILLAGALTCLFASASLPAATSDGLVFCDADQDGQIGLLDVPLSGMLVVVTNTSGSYSNAAVTTANGSFSLTLPDTADTYVEYVSNLPAGTSAVFPPTGFWTFQISSALQTVSANFLVHSPDCQPQPAACWVKATGTGRNEKGKPDFQFNGKVSPACPNLAASSGFWLHTDKLQKLQLHGNVNRVLSSGTQDSVNFVEFIGGGMLKGISGNRVSYPQVTFMARLENGGTAGARYYLRVTDPAGQVLLLVSSDPANPDTSAPVAVDAARLQILFGTCENPPQF